MPLDFPHAWLPSSPALVASLRSDKLTSASAFHELQASLATMGAPPLDLLVTPMSARIGRMAFSKGLAFFHHESRGRLPMPVGLEPEHPVWADEGTLPLWQEGVLTEPKYFSFFQDTPFSPFNPNHRRKWRSHELLHALGGFFWHPEQTRFEAYLGARLGEILPVVHWYGWDEIFRPVCPKHRGRLLYQEFCPACEEAAFPFVEQTEDFLDEHAEEAFLSARRAQEHLALEWAACLREVETGQKVEVEHPRLNSSSDALGYLASHWPRLTAWSFGAWVERFLVEGVDYSGDIPRYLQILTSLAQDLTRPSLSPLVLPSKVVKLRARRLLQDLAYRCFLALETLEEGSRSSTKAEAALLPLLEDMAAYLPSLLSEGLSVTSEVAASESSSVPPEITGREGMSISPKVPASEGLSSASSASPKQVALALPEKALAFVEEILRVQKAVFSPLKAVPPEIIRSFPALGFPWLRGSPAVEEAMTEAAIVQVKEGLFSAASDVLQPMSTEIEGWLRRFLSSAFFGEHGRLLERFSRFLQHYAAHDSSAKEAIPVAFLERLRFEAWLKGEPLRDQEAEDFAAIPDDLWTLTKAPGSLRLHRTFRRASWSPALLEAILSTPISEAQPSLAAIHHGEQKRLILLDPPLATVFTAIHDGTPAHLWLSPALLSSLAVALENAFVVWLPAPRPR